MLFIKNKAGIRRIAPRAKFDVLFFFLKNNKLNNPNELNAANTFEI